MRHLDAQLFLYIYIFRGRIFKKKKKGKTSFLFKCQIFEDHSEHELPNSIIGNGIEIVKISRDDGFAEPWTVFWIHWNRSSLWFNLLSKSIERTRSSFFICYLFAKRYTKWRHSYLNASLIGILLDFLLRCMHSINLTTERY